MESPQGRDKSVAPGVQASQLDGPFDGIGAIVDEEGVLQLARGDGGQNLAQRCAPRLQQLLTVERHTLDLVGNRLDDLGVIDTGAEDAKASQAIDVLPTEQIAQHGALSGPFDGRELARFSDRFAIGYESTVVVLLVAID